MIKAKITIEKGGPGSGHFGHVGRPGKVGGSMPSTGIGAVVSIVGGRHAEFRQFLRSQGLDKNTADTLIAFQAHSPRAYMEVQLEGEDYEDWYMEWAVTTMEEEYSRHIRMYKRGLLTERELLERMEGNVKMYDEVKFPEPDYEGRIRVWLGNNAPPGYDYPEGHYEFEGGMASVEEAWEEMGRMPEWAQDEIRAEYLLGTTAQTALEGSGFTYKNDWDENSANSYEIRGALKHKIVQDIQAEIKAQTGAEVEYDTVNTLIKQWSHSSNNQDMRSLSLQEAASEEFGLDLTKWQRGKIQDRKDLLERNIQRYAKDGDVGGFEWWYRKTADGERVTPLFPRETERHFLRAMYQHTQDTLQKQGYREGDYVRLYRGFELTKSQWDAIAWDPSEPTQAPRWGMTVNYESNVMESWSVSRSVANQFAGSTLGNMVPVVVSMDVPIQNILSLASTGFGCFHEGEVVVLGGHRGIMQTARVEKPILDPGDESWILGK